MSGSCEDENALLMSEVSSGGTRAELDGAIAPSETYLAFIYGMHHLHITSSIQTNQIYNIIYSLNIMISKRLHLLKYIILLTI